LTKIDDEIYEDIQSKFPELFANDARGIANADEELMKNRENKLRWRNFIEGYRLKINDYNFGSLLRTNCADEYSEENTIFVLRLQFLAFEIARNRLGLNDEVHWKALENS